MTKEEIIAMAIEADCMRVNMYWDRAMAVERLSRFAALVAAKEREACAQVADATFRGKPGQSVNLAVADAIRARSKT